LSEVKVVYGKSATRLWILRLIYCLHSKFQGCNPQISEILTEIVFYCILTGILSFLMVMSQF